MNTYRSGPTRPKRVLTYNMYPPTYYFLREDSLAVGGGGGPFLCKSSR